MTFPGFPIETSVVDPVTGEPVFGAAATEVVPESAENLLAGEGAGADAAAAGGCCGGSCCQG